MEFDDLDPTIGEFVYEVSMISLSILDPHHVVEEEIIVVGRGQPAMCQPRRANQDLAQLADF